MGTGIFFPLCALPVIIIIILAFNLKKHIKTEGTKLYNILCISNFFGLILEILCALACKIFDTHFIIASFILKTYLVYLIFWTAIFTSYIFKISSDIKNNKLKIFHYFFLALVILTIYVLPIDVVIKNNFQIHYSTGMSVTFSYLISMIYVAIILFIIIKNIKNIRNKKYLPVFLFLIIGIISIIVQYIHPEFLLLTYAETLICLCMYFTIENPDLKMVAQLELARDNAEKANRAKSDFLSSMSHEIRTPLNAIVGLSEDNLSYEENCPKEVIENSHDIMNASQTLLEIVGNILDINKIESEKLEIIEKPYDFRESITNMCKIMSTRIGEKDIKFNLNIADDLPYELIGDKVHVKEIINNILSNAIKYTEQGEVNLTVKCVNDYNKRLSNLIITCQDTGRGIKKEYISKLFTKFERLDIEKNTTTEGTGLGLAITKALTEMMGGTINVSSQFGKGSIFVINIPQKVSEFQKPMTEKEMVDTASKLFNNNKENMKVNINYGHKKVLIVDDNKLNIKVAKRAISDFDLEIDECYDGLECLNKVVVGNEYDLILMDIMMPNMSGETAIKRLKENPSFNIPVIALTADAVVGAKEKYVSEGFIDYIAKPFDKEQIKQKLDIVFENNIPSNQKEITNINNQNVEAKEEIEDSIENQTNKNR